MLSTAGEYTGDSVSGREIPVPFQPSAVIVKTSTLINAAVFRTSTMDSGDSAVFGNNVMRTDCVLDFTATGFTVGNSSEVNNTGNTYYWWAVQADADDCAVITWTGDGTDDKSVGSVSFTPEFAMVKPDTTARISWRTNQLAGDLSQEHNATAVANRIQALQAGSIQVGTLLNANGIVYHALILKAVANLCAITEYTGDGNDDRNVAHGLGEAPVFAMVQSQDVTAQNIVIRFGDQTGDNSMQVFNQIATADQIQAMDATNVQVGTHAAVNQAASTPTYTLVTFGEDLGISQPTISSISPDNGPKGGGTSVTITGTGYLASPTVTFGGTNATNVAVNGTTEITCTTPQHAAGAVDVVVTNTDTGTVTSSGGFTFNQSNAPSGGGGGSGGGRGRGGGGGGGGPGGGLGGGGRDKGAFRKMRWRL